MTVVALVRRAAAAPPDVPGRVTKAFTRALTLNLFAAAVLVTAYIIVLALHPQPDRLYDFRTFWNAGRDIIAGDPGAFIYPPPIALAMVPLALLPFTIGAAIYVAILLLSIALTLLVLDVRDPRCYAVFLLSWPTVTSLGNGAISTLLALGLALTWRYRDRRWTATAVVAATIVAKLFLWPLWFWLMATRRYATAVTVAVAGAVGALGGWAVIGFAGLRDYPELLNRLAALVQEEGYSPIALGLALGLPIDLARAAAFALGAGLLVAMFVLARRPDGDRRSFVVAIVAAFVFSPIVWLHYLTLLVVPVAMVAKRLSILWFVPIAYLTSGVNSEGNASTIAVVWLITAALVLATLRPRVSALGSSTARSAVAA